MNFIDFWYHDISFVVNHSIYYEDILCEVIVTSIVQLKEICVYKVISKCEIFSKRL